MHPNQGGVRQEHQEGCVDELRNSWATSNPEWKPGRVEVGASCTEIV